MLNKRITTVSILGAFAIVFGALGAHWVKAHTTPENVEAFKTGATYHLTHAIVLLVLVFFENLKGQKIFKYSYTALIIGIVCFSFSLYGLILGKIFNLSWITFLGPVTPLGGLFLIAGWILIIFDLKRLK